MRHALTRRPQTRQPIGDPRHLAEQILAAADTLTQLLERAAALEQPIPPPIANTVLDLRGWAVRISYGTAERPAAMDATRVLAYLRGLPDQQLLAVLADLPWARLDALLDAIQISDHASSREGLTP